MQRTHQKEWLKIVEKVKKGSKGGNPGQWSARKAQLAVYLYKKKGYGYLSKKSKNNSLAKWTRQKWRTKSGSNSIIGPNATYERYLPEKVILSMSSKDYKKTSLYKKRDTLSGKQYSKTHMDNIHIF